MGATLLLGETAPLKLPPDTECPLLPSQPFTKTEVIGFVIGSASSVLYLLSRLPQIRTNVSFREGWDHMEEGHQVKQQYGSGVSFGRSRPQQQLTWVKSPLWLLLFLPPGNGLLDTPFLDMGMRLCLSTVGGQVQGSC